MSENQFSYYLQNADYEHYFVRDLQELQTLTAESFQQIIIYHLSSSQMKEIEVESVYCIFIKRTERPHIIQSGALTVDLKQELVYINDEIIHLFYKEWELLRLLISSPRKVFTAEDLLEKIWHEPMGQDTKKVLVNISTLRKKIEQQNTFIKTIRGKGYYFDLQTEDV